MKAINEDAKHCSFSLELYSTLGTTQLGDSRHNWNDSKLENGVPLFARAVTVSLQSLSSTDGLASSGGQQTINLAESLFVCKLWVEMS